MPLENLEKLLEFGAYLCGFAALGSVLICIHELRRRHLESQKEIANELKEMESWTRYYCVTTMVFEDLYDGKSGFKIISKDKITAEKFAKKQFSDTVTFPLRIFQELSITERKIFEDEKKFQCYKVWVKPEQIEYKVFSKYSDVLPIKK